MTDHFYNNTDWESSSGPLIVRQYAVGDIWPVGLASEDAGGNKDVLAAGLHPCVAIGPKASRGVNSAGVVVSYQDANLVQINIARGFCFKAYVANVLTYNAQGGAATFDQSLAIGEPVYVDDSDALDEGVTLSRSPLNGHNPGAANPRAGWLYYDQDDFLDSGVGGPNAAADWPKAVANALTYTLVTVMLDPD